MGHSSEYSVRVYTLNPVSIIGKQWTRIQVYWNNRQAGLAKALEAQHER
jgi:hypothetical protein